MEFFWIIPSAGQTVSQSMKEFRADGKKVLKKAGHVIVPAAIGIELRPRRIHGIERAIHVSGLHAYNLGGWLWHFPLYEVASIHYS